MKIKVQLINSDNDDVTDLLNKKGTLIINKDEGSFKDLDFHIVDVRETQDTIRITSPYFFYAFSKNVT